MRIMVRMATVGVSHHQMLGRTVISIALAGAVLLLAVVLAPGKSRSGMVGRRWLDAAPTWEIVTVWGVALCGIVVASSGFLVIYQLLTVG